METNCTGACFEQGPIRPPSEARSLLLRVTRNCTWNRCEFCSTYKNQKFSKRSVEEVKNDIRAMKNIADDLRSLSRELGKGGEITREVVQHVFNLPEAYGDQPRGIAVWLYLGGATVFLQDADSVVLPTDVLEDILLFLREQFPHVSRITSYARSKTVSRTKTVEDLVRLRQAGLNRLHIGMESGYDPLLKYVRKGVTAAEHVDAGRKIKAAGIELSEYVILGLGGRNWWKEHALGTAEALNRIDPDFIRFRSLKVLPSMELAKKVESGEFELQTEEEVVREERLLIETLEGITGTLVSDHILNLLMEVEGTFPDDKEDMLATIDRFLGLPDDRKINFRLGKRAGVYDRMDDMSNPSLYAEVEGMRGRIEKTVSGGVEEAISRIKETYL